jgi:hypothetical protein
MSNPIRDTAAEVRKNPLTFLVAGTGDGASCAIEAPRPATTKENRMNRRTRTGLAALAVTAALGLSACSSDADVASHNLSKYILEITGRCSLGNDDPANQLSVTCMTGPNEYKKHFLGLSDNVTYFAEQIADANVSKDNYRVVFKPSTIVPDVDAR